MIVRCVSIKPIATDPEYGFDPFHLEVGLQYNVYGIEVINGSLFYYLAPQPYAFYPILYLSVFFEVTYSKVSAYWHLDFKNGNVHLLFEDWIKDPDFLRKFIDDVDRDSNRYLTLKSFQEYKDMIDEEMKNDSYLKYINWKQ